MNAKFTRRLNAFESAAVNRMLKGSQPLEAWPKIEENYAKAKMRLLEAVHEYADRAVKLA